eukprot:353298-Pelagomonas_calceolata.AAC.1
MYGDVALPEKEQFRYLGILVDKHMNLKVSEEHAVQPYMAAQQRIKEFVYEYDRRNRPHALIWLSKVYEISAGMYACQVRGTEYLQEGGEFKSQLQKRQLCSLRRTNSILAVKAAVKFFNNMLVSSRATLRQVLKADLHLADMDESCWSAHVSKSFSGMRNEEVQTAEGLEGSGCPQSPRGKQESSDLPSLDLNKGVMRNATGAEITIHTILLGVG